jgi:hypothetical protein
MPWRIRDPRGFYSHALNLRIICLLFYQIMASKIQRKPLDEGNTYTPVSETTPNFTFLAKMKIQRPHSFHLFAQQDMRTLIELRSAPSVRYSNFIPDKFIGENLS